ncbi:DUF2065 family protein [Chitinimonas koreensis]|nr:DUF2065 family protein [Chitinimonas koreensis]
MWDNLAFAVALVLVAEGLLPFLSPRTWRNTFEQLAKLTDGQLRFVGLALLLIGSILLAL